jgi:CubicO group peptidase (beta-lactamase class C family)
MTRFGRGRIAGIGLALLGLAIAAPVDDSARAQTPAPSFTEATRAAAALPRLHSLLVSRRGELLFEYYAPPITAARLANVKSVSKSVISTLVGIALDRKLIKRLDEPVATFFPRLRRDPDARKQAITVEDLVSMRSGLESTSGAQYGRWVRSRDWVASALGRPLVSTPGTVMEYSTGSSHLLSAILTQVSGVSTWQFAQTVLGKPIGIDFAPWPRDPRGIYFGGNEMLMTPRQMVGLGELYLNDGRARGQQVVSAEWVKQSCVPRTVSRWDPDREYGYGWWIDEVGGHQSCYAWGFGGQFIFVFRDLGLVVVTTSATDGSEERWDYRDRLLALIAQHVLAPLATAPSRDPSRARG